MNNKAQELDIRNIMQGLEEFATFMSFRSNTAGLRILSVETVSQFDQTKQPQRSAAVIKLPVKRASTSNTSEQQQLHKSLYFKDRQVH